MKRSKLLIITSFCLALLFQQIQAENNKLSPNQIFERMGEVYRNCRSYNDSGKVKETYFLEGKNLIVQKPFKIYFTRPNFFRFEWKGQIHPEGEMFFSIVWCNGNETFTYSELGRFEKIKSIEDGIIAHSGVSSGGINTVPMMLINQENSFIFNKLIDKVLLKEEAIDGVKCYVIQAKFRKSGKEIELWIGKDNFLFRKLKTKSKFPTFSCISEESHRNIYLNKEISSGIFNFVPPDKHGLKN